MYYKVELKEKQARVHFTHNNDVVTVDYFSNGTNTEVEQLQKMEKLFPTENYLQSKIVLIIVTSVFKEYFKLGY